jgi:Ca2+-binding RTX toxin-like protein
VFNGYGFSYDSNGYPNAGTVTGYATYLNGKKIGSITGLNIAATAIVAAASTSETSDDVTLFKSVFSGNDVLIGGQYKDRLEGLGGQDKLVGGRGADKLFGGTGADAFIFKSVKDSTVSGSGRDSIQDFSARQKDKIDLSAIDAKAGVSGNQSFTFIGKEKFHGEAGELRYKAVSSGALVLGDVNGDGNADFSIFVKGVFAMSKVYFIL